MVHPHTATSGGIAAPGGIADPGGIPATGVEGTAAPEQPPTTETSSRGVAMHSLWRMGSRVISSAALGICLLLTARGTVVGDFGAMMTAYSVGLIVGLAAGVGAPARILRAPAEARKLHGVLFAVHSVLVCASWVVLVTICAALGFAGWAVIAGLVFALGDTVQNYAQGHLTSLDEQGAANALVISHRLIPLAAAVISYVWIGHIDFAVLAVAFAVPVVIGLVVPYPSARRSGMRGIAPVFTDWLGYWAYSGSAMLNQLQLPVLGAVATAGVVGMFAMSARVVGPITLLTASITAVIVPELAKRVGEPDRFGSLYRKLVAVCAGYFVVVLIVSWPVAMLVVALAGPQYQAATLLVAATIVGAGLSAWSQGYNAKLLAVGKPGLATMSIVAGAVLAVAMLFGLGVTGRSDLLWTVPVVSQVVVVLTMSWAAARSRADER